MADEEDIDLDEDQENTEELGPEDETEGGEEEAEASSAAGHGGEGQGQKGQQRQQPLAETEERKTLSRGEKRIAKLATEAREAREAANRISAQFQELQAQVIRQQGAPARIDPREEQERLAQMDPEQRTAYLLEQSDRKHQQQLGQMQFNMNDNLDRTEFNARVATDPRAARYKDEVEKALSAARQQGINPKRETLFYYLLGQKVANNQAKKQQASAGQKRVAAATTRPTNTSGDVARGGKSGNTLEKRLSGLLI